MDNPATEENISNKKIIMAVILVLLILPIVIGIVILTSKNQKTPFSDANSAQNASSEKEALDLQRDISKIMILPNETPVAATITDLSKISDQPFFKNAAIGDKVLIFQNARKAILYRPSKKLIVEVGTLNTDPAASGVAGESTEANPLPTTIFEVPVYEPLITPES